jgi:hypothetical protein
MTMNTAHPHSLARHESRRHARTWAPVAAGLAGLAFAVAAHGYSNDFQNASTAFSGFTASGNLTGLALATLPTGSGGLGSAGQSTWLGRLGAGVGKNGNGETVTLALTGLTAGQQYTVAFDLFIGASWDGSAGGYGPDLWALKVQSGAGATQTLVNATFANGQQGINFGADSRQSYSDATPLGGIALSFNRFTGADAYFSLNANGNYASDYSIYRFGRGAGNPVPVFTANASTARVMFQRVGTVSGDSADEYWALDNIAVSGAATIPEADSYAMMLACLGLLAVVLRRRAPDAC